MSLEETIMQLVAELRSARELCGQVLTSNEELLAVNRRLLRALLGEALSLPMSEPNSDAKLREAIKNSGGRRRPTDCLWPSRPRSSSSVSTVFPSLACYR